MPATRVAQLKRSTCRSIRATLAVVVATVALLGFGSAAGGAATAAASPIAGIGVWRLGNSYPTASGYDRYAYVEVGVANAAAAGALNTTSLVYASGTSIPQNYTDGVSYSQALANNWLLKDSSGNYVENVSYGRYIGDFGDPGYQQAFAQWALTFLAQNHNEGLKIDDTICDAPALTGGVYPAKYPTQQAWENAQVSFISTVGDILKAHGYYVMVNATCKIRGNAASNDGSLTAAFWQRLAPHVSGLCSEYWQQLPSQPTTLRLDGNDTWMHFWSSWQSLVNVAQNAGVDFFAAMSGSSTATNIMRYGKASFLLDWDGKGGAFMYLSDGGSTDPWNPEWTTDIGTPAGAKYQVGVGWRRNYTAGTALVNPNPTTSQQFALGGTYLMADGTAVTSVTLAPGEGIVLRASTAATAPDPTPTPTPTPPPADPTPAPPPADQTPAPAPASTSTAVKLDAPKALALPSIDGLTQVGQTLTATTGLWAGPPTSYAYQWQRCDLKAKKCKTVGDRSSTYVLTSADYNTRLRVVVKATNSRGSKSATSAATAPVTF
jgi:hypothetical protein